MPSKDVLTLQTAFPGDNPKRNIVYCMSCKRIFRVAILAVVAFTVVFLTAAQDGPTPVPVIINSPTPQPSLTSEASPIPPTFTPTDQGPAQLLVPPDSGSINARSDPDIDSQVLGQINAGEQYPVTGRYFRWIQFRYEPSPSGYAYVYDDLVEINGDLSTIADLSQATPTAQLDTASLDATSTVEALQLTPGYDLTLTASVREIEAPSGFSDEDAAVLSEDGEVRLPTFTPPPNLAGIAPPTFGALAAPTEDTGNQLEISVSDDIAPIVPIVIFATLGIIGLLLSTLQK